MTESPESVVARALAEHGDPAYAAEQVLKALDAAGYQVVPKKFFDHLDRTFGGPQYLAAVEAFQKTE